MTAERWQQIGEIYRAALEREPNERGRYVDHACAGDEELRREVESLLSHESRASQFLDQLRDDVIANLVSEQTLEGRTLSHYQVLSKLGEGGMGEVYVAFDTVLGRKVALKFLRRQFTQNSEHLHRFTQEVHTISALNHPNIISVFEVGESESIHFMATELVEGQTLQQRLATGPLPLDQLLDIAIQIASALVTAHQAGIVHRDIKPANIMLRHDGYVKVLDFGVAKLLQEQHPGWETQTRTGYVIGTPRYMSPEQQSGSDLDARSDLFSLGVVLRELAGAEIDPELARIVQKATAEDREKRYQSAAGLLSDLKQLKLDLAVASHASKTFRTRRAWPVAAFSVTALVLTAAGFGVYRYWPAAPRSGAVQASIAVLPFTDLSPGRDQEYFSDGLTEEVLDALTKIPALHVAGRNPFAFRGSKEDYSHIGKKLKVATLLEGSVRRQGNRARITVRLVKAADGFTLWSNTFDREVSDIFAVQQEIGHAVTRALNIQGAKVVGQSTNPKAYTAYLQGRYFLRRSQNTLSKAVSYFEESIRHDDRYASAWSGLGYARMNQVLSGYVPPEQGLPKAREAVERALKLDPDLSEAYSTLGTIKMTCDFDWSGAQAAYDRALSKELGDPKSVHGPVPAMLGAATLNRILGRWPDAIRFFNQALELDPLNESAYPSLGQTFYYAGRHEEAITALQKGLEVSPETVNLHGLMCRVRLAQSRPQDALSEANSEQHPAFRLQTLSLAHAALGHEKESQEALQQLIAKFGNDAQYQIAEVYAFRGEANRAFAALGRAYTARDPGLTELKGDPLLKNLERDPRYVALLKRMGLPL